MSKNLTQISIVDNSKAVLNAEKKAVEAGLIKIGEAAVKNTRRIIEEKNIIDTGDLLRSIDYQVNESDQSVSFGTPQDYGPYLELGTSRIPARPFVKPAALDNVNEYKKILEDELKNG